MRPHVLTLASLLLASGCGGDGGGSAALVPTPAPTPTPTPTPPVAPTPTPTPTPPAAPAYLTFSEVYIYRFGASISLPSACSGVGFQGQPPAALPVTPFGQGLSFRFVITPQVWSISGEVSVGFDGRDGDPAGLGGAEVALVKMINADTYRFTITRPAAGGAGLDYARLGAVSAPVGGVSRQYQCLLGIPTLVDELPAAPSGSFSRTTMMGTAYVRDGATSRPYSLGRSTVSLAADIPARRVAATIRLVGTPMSGGTDIELGTVTASAPIDATTGNFTAPLASTDRSVTGTISGRLFGPQAIEVGAVIGASVAEAGAAPAYSVTGGVYGAR